MSRTKMRIAQSAVAAYDVKAESDPSFIINNKEKDEKTARHCETNESK